MKNSNVNITVQTPVQKTWKSVLLGWLEWFNKLTFKQLIIVFVCAIFGGIVAIGYNLSKQEDLMSQIIQKSNQSEEAEEENLQIRDEITPKVQKEMDKLMYQVGADRVCLFEVHNGKANSTSLPFRYVDCTQESVNSDHMVTYIGDKYQDAPLSHYKIAYSLADCKYINLTYQEMKRYDERFAQEMSYANGKQVAASMISSNGIHIGFLICFYDNTTQVPNNSEIKPKIESASKIIGALLDLNVQRRLKFQQES